MDTHESRRQLRRDGQQLCLERLNHDLHAAVQDIQVRLVG
jgi:hypothetical protein